MKRMYAYILNCICKARNMHQGIYQLGTVALRKKASIVTLKVFTALYSRPWTGVQYIVHQEANRVGKLMMRSWLGAHGFVHCARCLSLKDIMRTLVEVDGQRVYLCRRCNQSGVEAGLVTPVLDIVRP